MLVALFCVAAWPLLRTIYFSLTDTTLDNLHGGKFVWFYNYFHIQTLASGKVNYRGALVDPSWWNAVYNTVRFSITSVIFETVFGMAVALMLNADFKGRGIARAAILVPWAIPTIVSAKMWAWMLNDQYGIINDIMMNLHLIDHKIAWASSPDTAMIAVLIVDIWKATPFMALLWPALVTTGLLAFIGAWNEFLFVLTFTISEDQRTTPVAIALLSGASTQEIPWGPIMAASVVVTVPVVVLVLIFQRKIVAGLTAGGVKG
jgi:ABC-type sugar transport system permease subunit